MPSSRVRQRPLPAEDLLVASLRLMIVAPRFPYPLDKGDRLTVFNLLKHFAKRHRVALVTFLEPGQRLDDRRHFEGWVDAIYTVPLSRPRAYWRCARGALSRRPLQTCYYMAPEMTALVARAVEEFQPDLLYAHTIRMGEYLLAHRGRPTVLAMQIAMTLNYGRLARFSRGPLAKLLYGFEHRKVRAYEPWIARQYSRCLLISPADVQAIGDRLDNVLISPHGVDFEYFAPAPNRIAEPGRIVFTGNMGYAANVDAICYFVAEILPLIRAQQPDVRLAVVGTDPAPAVRRLARDPAIDVTGRVPDLRGWLDRAEVAIDPLRIGAGLQNKVLEGMAMALPMVITSAANEGIGARDGEHVLIVDDSAAFAAAVVGLLRRREQAVALGHRARQFIVENWSWQKHFDALEAELVHLAAAWPAPGTLGSEDPCLDRQAGTER
jgi:polysaccharide biosynthesis protein PslH